MSEAATVRPSANRGDLSPLFDGFWYLSPLTSVFCGQFPANSMTPKIRGGGGIPRAAARSEPLDGFPASNELTSLPGQPSLEVVL